jgi:hypothetical protein
MKIKTKNLFRNEQIFLVSGSDGRCSTCYNPVFIPPGTQPNEAKKMIQEYLETGKAPELPFD